MINIRIRPVVPVENISQTINNKINKLQGTTRRDILNDLAKVFKDESQKRVHIITGKTRNSMRLTSEGNQKSTSVSMGFGALPEIRRGGPHNFAIPAQQETSKQFPSIARRHLSQQ